MNNRCNLSSFGKFFRGLLFWAGAFLSFLPLAVSAADDGDDTKVLRVAYIEFPPFEYRAENGEPAGAFVDITQKVMEEAGYRAEFVYLPTNRMHLYLKNGEIDVWPGLTNIPILQGQILESWASPFSTSLSAWNLKDREPLERFDQLKGKTVIVIAGYTYNGLISWMKESDQITVTEAPNHWAAVQMLKLNRGDYLLDYSEPVRNALSGEDLDAFNEAPIRRRSGAWLFSLGNPRAAVLREVFDDAYMNLLERDMVPPVQDKSLGPIMPGFPEQYL